jgi:hypothetical protein
MHSSICITQKHAKYDNSDLAEFTTFESAAATKQVKAIA